jgi:hypothetical protein
MTRGSVPQQSPPEDKKELERSSKKRYAIQSGQSSIHGRALWEIQSQESQTMGFYASNGQGGSGNGASTAKHVLFTPGSSLEHLGQNLKAKGIGDGDYNPAKVIVCEHGDIHLEAKDGDIFLKGKNIHIFADGGGDKGNIDLRANKNLNLKSSTIKLQSEGIFASAKKDLNLFSQGFMDIQSGFTAASTFADSLFSGPVQAITESFSLGETSATGEPTNTGEPTDKATEDLQVGESNVETESVAAEERDLIESQQAQTLLEGGEITDGNTTTSFELI